MGILAKITKKLGRETWTVVGYDRFAGERYFVSEHLREADAKRAAARYQRKLDKTQPPETSGGKDGIQDQVYVMGPGEEKREVEKKEEGGSGAW